MDAEKRTLIKHLPHTLVLHLKRFEFDYETFQRWKVGAACRREATQHSGRGCCCNAGDIECERC